MPCTLSRFSADYPRPTPNALTVDVFMRKKSLLSSLVLVALVVIALLCLLYFPARHYLASMKASVVHRIEEALQKNVSLEIKKVRIALYRGFGFRLYDLSLRERGEDGQEILSAESLFVGLDFRSLLHGEIRIHKLYGLRPRIFFVRDASGRLNVEELFSDRYLKENAPEVLEDTTLGQILGPLLWKDRVAFKHGEIVFRDRTRTAPEILCFRDLDFMVKNELDSDSLAIKLSGVIRKPLASGSFSLEGLVQGWRKARRVSELDATVSVDIRDVALKGLTAYLPEIGKGDRIDGMLKGSLFYIGSLVLPGKARIELEVKKPFFQMEDIHTRPLSPDRVALTTTIDADRKKLSFTQGGIQLGDLELQWGGSVKLAEDKVSFLDISIKGNDLPLVEAKQYIPLNKLDGKVWPFLVNMAKGGTVDILSRLKGEPKDFSRMETPEGEDALYLWIHFKDVTVVLPVDETYLPFRSTTGVLELTNGTLFFRDFISRYGESPVSDIQGEILSIHQSRSDLNIKAKADLELPEILQELDHGIFPDAIRQISRGLSDVSGEGSLDIAFGYEFGSDVEEEILRITGGVDLKDVHARHEDLNLSLKEALGRVAFTESSISGIHLDVNAGRSPVHVAGQVQFADQGRGAVGEIRLASDAFLARDFMVMLGGEDEITGILACEAKVAWDKGELKWLASLRGETFEVITGDYLLSGEKLRAKLEGENGSVHLRELALRLQGNVFHGSGAWTSLDPVKGRIEIQSPSLDLNSFFRRKRTQRPWDKLLAREGGSLFSKRWEEGLEIKLEIGLKKFFYKSFFVEDALLEGRIEKGDLFIKRARAKVGEGRITLKGQADLKDDNLPFSLLYSLSNVRAEDFFGWLSMNPDTLTGPLFMEGNLKGDVRPSDRWEKSLHGNVSLYGGPCIIQKYELMGKILTLINFTQWTKVRLSDLNSRGISCRQIKGNFHIEKGSIRTENLLFDTSIALSEIKGEYDFMREKLDLDLTLRPMEPLDQVLDKLPVVGRVFNGPDGTMVVFNYRIEGPVKDPEVRLVPLSGLNNRIRPSLKKLNEWLESLKQRLSP